MYLDEMMNTMKYIDNVLMKPSRMVFGFKNMTNTGISFQLSTKVFSSLFIQIVRILMTLGCNPMVNQLS